MAAIKSTKVPKAFGEIYAVITTITDTFCRERLNEEYGELARPDLTASDALAAVEMVRQS